MLKLGAYGPLTGVPAGLGWYCAFGLVLSACRNFCVAKTTKAATTCRVIEWQAKLAHGGIMAGIYKNVAYLAGLFAVASMAFSVYAGLGDNAAYQKAAFIALSGLSSAYLGLCLTMARSAVVIDGRPLIRPTVWLLATLAVAMLGVGLVWLGLDTYADSVLEGIIAGTVGMASAITGAFVNAGQDEEG